MHSQNEFDEQQWIKMIFLLADTQNWLDDMTMRAFALLPVTAKKKLLSRDYKLYPSALAHILERHYYKISRHPQAGKFHIPLLEILHYLREARTLPYYAIKGNLNFERSLTAEKPIGFDQHGLSTNQIVIVTDNTGRIITAYPGQRTGGNDVQQSDNDICNSIWNDDYFEMSHNVSYHSESL